jgi:hypothetical protein
MKTSGLDPIVHVTMVDPRNGQVWWNSTTTGARGTAGYKYLPLNLTLTVTVQLLAADGSVLDSKVQTASTPAAPKVRTT